MKRVLCITFALAAAACAAAPAPAPAPVAPAARVLEGSVTLAPGVAPARGLLVVGWRTASEDAEERAGHGSIGTARALLERWRPAGEVDFTVTPRARYRITEAPPGAVPVVVLDVDHTFMATTFGGGHGLIGAATPGTPDVVIAPNRPPKGSESCTGERMQLVKVTAPEVAGAIGNPIERRFCAWLPPGYAASPERRYPVVFFFGGLMSNDQRFRGRWHPGMVADRYAQETGRELVIVAADLSTRSGSSYLEDSSATGAWDSFFARRVVPTIDAELRTLPRRTARALVGHSTGGHDALSYGLRHSELFTAIGASSPDAPDMEAWLFAAGTRTAKPWLLALTRLEDAVRGPGQMTSYGADWSPDASTRGWAWPFDLRTGAAVDAVVARWVEKSPSALVEAPGAVARIKRDLDRRIFVTVGDKDEFDLFEPAARFSAKLTRLGVEHTFRVTQGGHVTNVEKQLDDAIRFVGDAMDASR